MYIIIILTSSCTLYVSVSYIQALRYMFPAIKYLQLSISCIDWNMYYICGYLGNWKWLDWSQIYKTDNFLYDRAMHVMFGLCHLRCLLNCHAPPRTTIDLSHHNDTYWCIDIKANGMRLRVEVFPWAQSEPISGGDKYEHCFFPLGHCT